MSGLRERIRAVWRKLTGQQAPRPPVVREHNPELHELRGKLQGPVARSAILRDAVQAERDDVERAWAARARWERGQ